MGVCYFRKDGTAKEQGPYLYFRYHEGGKQKKLYLGKTDDRRASWRANGREADNGATDTLKGPVLGPEGVS